MRPIQLYLHAFLGVLGWRQQSQTGTKELREFIIEHGGLYELRAQESNASSLVGH